MSEDRHPPRAFHDQTPYDQLDPRLLALARAMGRYQAVRDRRADPTRSRNRDFQEANASWNEEFDAEGPLDDKDVAPEPTPRLSAGSSIWNH